MIDARRMWTVRLLLAGALLGLGAGAGHALQAPAAGAGAAAVPLTPPAAWSDAIERFAHALHRDVAADGVGGIAAGVVLDGDLVWASGFGWADRERRVPMSPSAISRTGSISKSVTALVLLRLVDRGIVGLDEPVERYLPAFASVRDRRAGAPAVTFRHLASHTAGIVREPDWNEAATGPLGLWEKRIVESLAVTAYDSVPGMRYQYSNIGFGALGLALSRAAGRPFMELVHEEVFGPLGMTGSAFVVSGTALEPRLAAGYQNRRDGTIDAEQPAREHAGRGYKVPNGGVYSTVADLGRFLGAVSGAPGLALLTEESRQEMIRVQTPEDERAGYGLGFSVRLTESGRRMVSHGGSVAGYTAYMVVDADAGVGVVLLRNYGGGATNLGRAAQGLVEELAALGR